MTLSAAVIPLRISIRGPKWRPSTTLRNWTEMLGIDGVKAILRDIKGEASSDAILADLAAARHRFAGHEIPDDDVLLMATRFTK
jgi:hypothetical protein